jgi:hypothetical protein
LHGTAWFRWQTPEHSSISLWAIWFLQALTYHRQVGGRDVRFRGQADKAA